MKLQLPGQLRLQSVLLPTVISGMCFCNANKGWTNPSRKRVQASGWPSTCCPCPLMIGCPAPNSDYSQNCSLLAFKLSLLIELSWSGSHDWINQSSFYWYNMYLKQKQFHFLTFFCITVFKTLLPLSNLKIVYSDLYSIAYDQQKKKLLLSIQLTSK